MCHILKALFSHYLSQIFQQFSDFKCQCHFPFHLPYISLLTRFVYYGILGIFLLNYISLTWNLFFFYEKILKIDSHIGGVILQSNSTNFSLFQTKFFWYLVKLFQGIILYHHSYHFYHHSISSFYIIIIYSNLHSDFHFSNIY